MATVTDLGRLVVHLVGDATMYASMLRKAREDTASAIQMIKSAFEDLGGFFVAFADRSKMELALQGLMLSHGEAVTELTAKYKKFANEIQLTSMYSRSYILMLLRQAESHGVTGDAAERAVKNAIGLGAANNKNAQMYLRSTAALELGHSVMLHRMIPALRGVHNEVERNVIAQEKLAGMWGAVVAAAKSAAGEAISLGNAWESLRSDMGEAFSTVSLSLVLSLKDLVGWLRTMPDWLKQTIIAVMALVAALTSIAVVTPLVVSWFTVLKNMLIQVGAALMAMPLAGWIVLATAATVVLIHWIGKLVGAEGAMKKLSNAIEKDKKLTDQMTQSATAQTSRMLAQANALTPRERRTFLQENIRREESNLSGLTDRQTSAQRRATAGGLWGSIARGALGWTGAGADEQSQLEQVNRLLPVVRDRVNQLRASMQSLSETAMAARVAGEVADLQKKLELTAATLGMTATEQEIYKITTRGATEEQVAQLRALDAFIEAGKKAIKLREDVKSLTDNLGTQVNTFGMTSREVKLYELSLRGATDAQLSAAKALSAHMTWLEYYKDLQDKAAQVTKQFQDPQVAFAERLGELNEMLRAGYISWDTYNRALEDARKKLQGVEVAARAAAGATGAEALARTREFASRLAEQMGAGAGASMANLPPGIRPPPPPPPAPRQVPVPEVRENLREHALPPMNPEQAAAAAVAIVQMAQDVRAWMARPGWLMNFAGLGGAGGGG